VNSLVMIQPTLLSYSFNGPPQPALLDAESVRPDTILLLDTFFHVVVFHGETIAAWREQGYHEQEEHAAFRSLLEAPQADAQMIMDNRFPVSCWRLDYRSFAHVAVVVDCHLDVSRV